MDRLQIKHTMRLSKDFFLYEYTRSQHASREGINNLPTEEPFLNIQALNANVCQPLRDDLGRPITITSGYRNARVNELAGGVSTSDHRLGRAVDIECFGIPNMALAERIRAIIPVFDQLILEFPIRGQPAAGWVHVSYRRTGENRNQVVTAYRNPAWKKGSKEKKVLYHRGLIYPQPVGLV